MLSSGDAQEVGDHGTDGFSREPSFYSLTSIQSGSSHNSSVVDGDLTCNSWSREILRHSGSWDGKSKRNVHDNQCHSDVKVQPHMYSSSDAIICTADASTDMEVLEETSGKSLVVPVTEYIVVDIPLQMGMGSPYSSSCFILIDR